MTTEREVLDLITQRHAGEIPARASSLSSASQVRAAEAVEEMTRGVIPHTEVGYCHEACSQRTKCACGEVVQLHDQVVMCECGRTHIKAAGSAFVKGEGPFLIKRPGGKKGCPGFL